MELIFFVSQSDVRCMKSNNMPMNIFTTSIFFHLRIWLVRLSS